MAYLLTESLQPQQLHNAYRFLKNDKAHWSPGVTREEFDRGMLSYILTLRDELASGSYRPLPVRQYAAHKPDGGKRLISTYYLRDKFAQRVIKQVLDPLGEAIFHHDSYAYRPKRGVQQAVACVRERVHTGLEWMVDADIRKFFDTVPHRPLMRLVRGLVRDRDVIRLLEQMLDVGPHPFSLLRSRRGLLQGAVISPFLCNLYLHQFDLALARENIPFVRFADDFILQSQTEEEAKAAYRYAGQLLESFGLALHPEKSRVCRASPKVLFLGEPVVGKGKFLWWKHQKKRDKQQDLKIISQAPLQHKKANFF